MNSLSRILSSEEDIKVIDNGVGYSGNPPLRIDIPKMQALFFYVKTYGKAAPITICL